MSKHSIRIGRDVEAERPLQTLERLHAALAPALGAQTLLIEREPRVALGQLEDAALLAALGRAQLDRPAAAARERVAQRRTAAELALDHQQRRNRDVAAVVLQHELLRDLRQLALGLVCEVEGLAVGEHAVAHLEDLRVGVAPVDRDGDGVERTDRLVRDPPALQQRAHRAQAVALERRLLELLRRRRRAHAPLQVALDRGEAAGQEVDHAVDARAVVLLRDEPDARRLAALDVVVQARAAAAAARLRTGARAEHEHLREHLERRAHALGVGVRTEVRPPGAVALAREVHARKVLVERDRDERIGLVVAQADVEARPVLLDEALLGQQRLRLGGDDDALDVLDARHHLGVAGAARHLRFGEVRRHALAHRLGLADVDDATGAVAKQVHARLVGQGAALLGEARRRVAAIRHWLGRCHVHTRIGGANPRHERPGTSGGVRVDQ